MQQRTFEDARKYLDRVRKIPVCMAPSQAVKHTVDKIRPAGVLKIGAEVYVVDRMHKYTEGKKWEWFELQLTGVSTGDMIFLEWEKDDGLNLALWTISGLPLNSVRLNPSQLEAFDDDEEGYFVYDSEKFVYDESDEAVFYADCSNDSEPFYYWDFSGAEGRRLIGVENWSEGKTGREYEVCIGRILGAREVTILALGGGEGHA